MLEFAFVAPLLILLMLMIIDLGIMLMSQSLLDGAARDAARLIRTGQIAAAGNSITTFENQLCSDMAPIMGTSNCQQTLTYEVNCWYVSTAVSGCNQTTNGFGAVAFTACSYMSYQTPTSGTQCPFNPGSTSTIVAVQVTYNRSFIVPWVGACLTGGACWFGAAGRSASSGGGHSVPLVSTVVFQNEPFPASG